LKTVRSINLFDYPKEISYESSDLAVEPTSKYCC